MQLAYMDRKRKHTQVLKRQKTSKPVKSHPPSRRANALGGMFDSA